MFPEIEVDDIEDSNLSEETSMGKVFLFNFDRKEFELKDGRPVEATYEEAIKQWIAMLLITEQGEYKVYEDLEFGVSLVQFIGRKDIPVAVISSEIKRQIEEQLVIHPEIESVEDFDFSIEDGVGYITFSVQTRNGALIKGIESEVKYDG